MATKRKSRRAKGSTSTASQGLVLHVIKKDPECEWLADFVQQMGERFFGVERYEQLNAQQRAGWIRLNDAMARVGRSVGQGEADFKSVLGFLERVGTEEGSADLAEVEAEVEAEVKALTAGRGSENENAASSDALLEEVARAVHEQEIRDWVARRRVQLAWDVIVLGATVSCLLITTLIILGVIGDEARLLGGTAVTAGIALVGLLRAILWGRWNPPPPGQFR